jgi:endopeptidase Clp ATP-binding regulatory subunit ClpX
MKDKLIKCGDDKAKGYSSYTGQVPLGSIFASPQADNLGEKTQKSDSEKIKKINFDLKPEELESYLKRYVVRQEAAIAVLATKVCTHFQCLKLNDTRPEVGKIKNNIIMIGPTGVGKTYLVKLIAKKIGVPFVKADATKFSDTVYVGGDVDQLVRDLVHEAGDEIAWAENGIIYIDEIDKIAASQGIAGPDVSRTGVQRNLLKLLEETEVDLKIPHDLTSQLEAAMRFQKTGKIERRKVNTKNILFIVSGAFNSLNKIIGKRLNQSQLGFKGSYSQSEALKLNTDQLLQKVKAEDLIVYGFESEFVGRLPVIAVLESLDEEDLFHILSNPNCPITLSKRRDFKAYGIDVKFEPEALRIIARMSVQEKTGARGLVSAMERVMLMFEKKLPSSSVRRFAVTEKTVLDPAGELENLLNYPDISEEVVIYKQLVDEEKGKMRQVIAAFEAESEKKKGFPIHFSPIGVEFITDRVVTEELNIQEVINEIVGKWKDIKLFEENFLKEYSLKIKFDDEARDLIAQHAVLEKKEVADICHGVLKNYEHGLALVRKKLGNNPIILTEKAVNKPLKYLNDLIAEYFRSDK